MTSLKGDVVCIQETHFMSSKTPRCSHRAYPHIFQANAPVKKRGVLVAIKHSVAFQLHDLICDPNGRYIIMTCDLNNAPYTLVNLYAPNRRQPKCLNSLLKKVERVKKRSLLMCGDFNGVPNQSMDCSSPPVPRRLELSSLISNHNLYDTWRCLHASEKDYTHYSFPH